MLLEQTSLALTQDELEIVKNILTSLVPNHEIWIFGSRIHKNFKPYSDLDLVILGSERISPRKLADLRDAFSNSDLTFKVDLVIWYEVTDQFKKIIERDHIVLSQSSDF